MKKIISHQLHTPKKFKVKYFITPELKSISGGNKYDKNVLDYLHSIGFKIINIHPSNKSNSILKYLNIFNKIPKNSLVLIDGLIAPNFYTIIDVLTKKYKLILLIHHPVSYENAKFGETRLKLKERAIFSKVHSLITVSKTMKKVIQGMLNTKKMIDVIEPGVDDMYFNKYIKNNDSHSLVCVGSVIPRKNIEASINTLSYLDDKWTMSIIGKYSINDGYYQYLNNIISKLNLNSRIRFHGEIENDDDLITLLTKSSVYTCLSHYEGYGMANIEAGTLGLPLVVSDIPVFHENLKGFNRIYVSPNNYIETARAIDELSKRTRTHYNYIPHRWKDVGYKFKRVLNEQ